MLSAIVESADGDAVSAIRLAFVHRERGHSREGIERIRPSGHRSHPNRLRLASPRRDEDGREVPNGTVGYLAQRPSQEGYYALRYWNDPERTANLFRHGWIIAGDLARRDEAGYFWFEGRSDDVIKSSGYRIGPFEVESAILHHPAVAEAGVVGKPDPLKGQIVAAYVTLKPGQTKTPDLVREIQDTARRLLGSHAYPREVEIVDSLPKTGNRKNPAI